MAHFRVSFDFHDDRRNANTQDFRDELMEAFEQAVLENRMTNVVVLIDYEKEMQSSSTTEGLPKPEQPVKLKERGFPNGI